MSSWDQQEAKDSDLSGCEALQKAQPARIAEIRGRSEELWPEIPVVTGYKCLVLCDDYSINIHKWI